LPCACGLSTTGTGGSLDVQTDASAGTANDGANASADGRANGSDGAATIDGALDGPTSANDGAIDGATIDAAVDAGPYATRVSMGLVALYDFEEGAGAMAHDKIATAYDLTIDDTSKTTWHAHYLEVTSYTFLSGTGIFTKLVTAAKASHGASVEAWVKLASIDGSNYGRLVSLIQDSSTRDIDMGFVGSNLWASMLSGSTNIDKTAPTGLLHVVLTSTNADSTLRMYVNGAPFSTSSGANDPATFVGYQMFVMNDSTGDRGIAGDLHLLAFYGRALSAAEVGVNYAAGPDP
jgi:hypothetical protein